MNDGSLAVGMLAGLCGGFAEVAWVVAYCRAAGTSALAIAGEIAASVVPSSAGASFAPALGLAIHFLLSAVLGVAFALAIYRWVPAGLRRTATMGFALAGLLAIWILNFFIVLPVLHPQFVLLLPLPVTLASKVLFGLIMGGIVQICAIALAPALAALPASPHAWRESGFPR